MGKLVEELSQAKVLAWVNIADDETYQEVCEITQYLMLNTPDSEDNPYNDLIEFLADAIEKYETKKGWRFDTSEVTSVEVLSFLMEQHNLTQSDLPEIGNQAKVSEVLHGKRKLNVRQIKALSKRFNLPADIFIE